MKKTKGFCASIIFGFIALFQVQTVQAQYVDVEFFKDKDYYGHLFTSWLSSSVSGPSLISVPQLFGAENDSISSIRVTPYGAACLLMFEHAQYLGDWRATPWSIPDLRAMGVNFNDRISSYLLSWGSCQVGYGLGAVYEHFSNGSGGGYTYPMPVGHIMTRLGGFNDRASGAYVPPNQCLRMWRNSPGSNYNQWYASPDLKLRPGVHDLRALGFNDTASAFEMLEERTCWPIPFP